MIRPDDASELSAAWPPAPPTAAPHSPAEPAGPAGNSTTRRCHSASSSGAGAHPSPSGSPGPWNDCWRCPCLIACVVSWSLSAELRHQRPLASLAINYSCTIPAWKAVPLRKTPKRDVDRTPKFKFLARDATRLARVPRKNELDLLLVYAIKRVKYASWPGMHAQGASPVPSRRDNRNTRAGGVCEKIPWPRG